MGQVCNLGVTRLNQCVDAIGIGGRNGYVDFSEGDSLQVRTTRRQVHA
jgi:hypothetical protein